MKRRLKSSLPALALAAALIMVAFLGARFYAGQVFVNGLGTFKLKFVESGMPGKPVIRTIVTSGGEVVREEQVGEQVPVRVSTRLTPDEVQQVRTALAGLAYLSGDYGPSFWNQTTDHQYLSIVVTLGDGTTKELFLEGTSTSDVQHLLKTLNSIVGPKFQVRFYGP